ncbi:MAG TPA: O-methyltransferase [Myxococcales bacterium]|jgi:caffeoyl-CoA O-methyltransferase|nr:O-methyltransferase [Myxococcales bacterium]
MPTSPPSKGFGQGDPALAQWAIETFKPEDDVLLEIRARAEKEGLPTIAVGPMDGLHLEVLARACGTKKAVEIGTLGGYSGVCLLRGMGPSGVLHTFEISEHHAKVARDSFAKAGFANQAHVHVGPALDMLKGIESQGPFDLCFIDADKVSYPSYLHWAAKHLRVGGIVLGDNTFAWGEIHKPGGDGSRAALRTFDEQLAQGGHFRATMIPTAEGLAMGVKVR